MAAREGIHRVPRGLVVWGPSRQPSSGKLRIVLMVTVGIGGLSTLLSGGCAKGRVYVSQPQVNTRERLVGQRLADTEWLRSQYEQVDNITMTQQGIRESRAFSGFYAEIAAQLNPDQGPLGSLDTQNEELTKKAENWRLQEAEFEARQSYLDKVKSASASPPGSAAPARPENPVTPGTDKTPTAASGRPNETGQTPGTPSSLGIAKNDLPAVPGAQAPTRTEAKPMLLDLLHDRMAYRDALNTMIKARELDDAHDQAGMMLYDLSFNMSVVPGDESSRYVQVTLSLEPPGRQERIRQLHELFAKWRASLQATIASEIGQLQSRYLCKTLDDVDRQNLEWFFTSHLTGLQLRLRDRCAAIRRLRVLTEESLLRNQAQCLLSSDDEDYRKWRQDCCQTITDYRLFGLLDAVLKVADANTPPNADTLGKFRDDFARFEKANHQLAQDFDGFAGSCEIVEIIKSLQPNGPEPSPQVRRTVLKGIAWAVWSKYAHELGRIVEIGNPTWTNETDPDRLQLSGLEIRPVVSAERRAKEEASQGAEGSGPALGACILDEDMGISSAGECTFIHRLLGYENQLYALSVEPTEYAQNISDVAARETLINLVAALQAQAASAGVSANTRLQNLRRSLEVLHAIERRPLLTGFGMGHSDFGWVAGPKFAIRNGRTRFLHTPLRHDCSASIVVPAWLMRVKLYGESAWIRPDGTQGRATPLWGRDGLMINLPLSRDAIQRITLALTVGGPSDEPFLLTTRPRPRIDGGQAEFQLQAGRAEQCLVICGSELWRNPQVFVGAQKASRVEMLSDMEGIQAYFDKVSYPGQEDVNAPARNVDLLVVTAFGKARDVNAVTILPPPMVKPLALRKPPQQARLKTLFIEGSSGDLLFSCPRPAGYSRLVVKTRKADSGDNFEEKCKDEHWNDTNTEVTFAYADNGPSQMMEADLVLYAHPDSKEGVSLLKEGPARFARFGSQAERSLAVSTDSFKFRGDDATEPSLELTYPSSQRPLAAIAYPGFEDAGGKTGAMLLALHDPNGADGPELPLRAKKIPGDKLWFEVAPGGLAANRTRLLREAKWQIEIRLADGAGTPVKIPVIKDGKPAEISFKPESDK